MDYRVARLQQPKTVLVNRGLNVCRERDYTKNISAWKEKETFEELNILTDISFLKRLRDNIIPNVLDKRFQVGVGANYSPMFDSLGNWTNYALAGGIVSQLGKSYEPNIISQNEIRICWFGNISEFDGPYENTLHTIHSRWSEFAVGSLLNKDSINFGDIHIDVEENFYSDEFRELHLTHIDLNLETKKARVYFSDDRSISEPWFGYIHPSLGGKPSALSKVNSKERLKANVKPYDLKEIRRKKIIEVLSHQDDNSNKFVDNSYFEYLKELGKFVEVKE